MRLGPMLFSPAGRIRRRDYWLYNVFLLTTWFILSAVIYGTLGVLGYAKPVTTHGGEWSYVFLPLVMWASICITAKRLHDRNRTGWLAPLALVPVAGWIWAIIDCGVLQGSKGDNQYGPDPKILPPRP